MNKKEVIDGLNGILADANAGFARSDEFLFIQRSIRTHFPDLYNELDCYDSDVPIG